MNRRSEIRHEFVEFIPEQLDEGVLYISIPYTTAQHLCLCGCGYTVVTPLSPERWRLTFDGETVSLWPSIGNWSFDCQSHYWIERNRVRWSRRFGREEIDAVWARHRGARDAAGSSQDREATHTSRDADDHHRSPSSRGPRAWLRGRKRRRG